MAKKLRSLLAEIDKKFKESEEVSLPKRWNYLMPFELKQNNRGSWRQTILWFGRLIKIESEKIMTLYSYKLAQ